MRMRVAGEQLKLGNKLRAAEESRIEDGRRKKAASFRQRNAHCELDIVASDLPPFQALPPTLRV